MRRLSAGDVRALGPLFERHRGVVMSILRQTMRNPADLDDQCQEVFLALKDAAPRFRAGGSVRSLVVGIAAKKGKRAGAVAWLRRTLLKRNACTAEERTEPHQRSDAGLDAQRMLESLPEAGARSWCSTWSKGGPPRRLPSRWASRPTPSSRGFIARAPGCVSCGQRPACLEAPRERPVRQPRAVLCARPLRRGAGRLRGARGCVP